MSTTWELHYRVASRSSREFLLGGLDRLKHKLTEMLIDYLDDGDEIHVMIGDTKTLWDVFNELQEIGPPDSMTCEFDYGDFSGKIRLSSGEEGELTDSPLSG